MMARVALLMGACMHMGASDGRRHIIIIEREPTTRSLRVSRPLIHASTALPCAYTTFYAILLYIMHATTCLYVAILAR